jgi:hypothetical protein
MRASSLRQILLKDAFDKKNMASADSIIHSNFFSGNIKPTVRTMNIILEGLRNLDYRDKALEYYSYFTSKLEFQTLPNSCNNEK